MCETFVISKNCTVNNLEWFQLPLLKWHICSFLGQEDLPKDQNHQLFFSQVNMKLKCSLFSLTKLSCFSALKMSHYHFFFWCLTWISLLQALMCVRLYGIRELNFGAVFFSVPILLDRPYFQFPLCGTISDIFWSGFQA